MLDPRNPFAPQPTGFEGLETFDPYGGGIATSASFYNSDCDPGGININCGCSPWAA